MRKLLLTFALLVTVVCGMTAQDDVMYVYRNDGVINTIFKDELDSMVCSRVDVDGLEYKDYVVQEIYTIDSLYRIPINLIDSISFVTPETIYKDGVVLVKDFRDYVVSVENLTINLRKDIPAHLIPQVGTKLVTTELSDVFPAGFAGEVEDIQVSDDVISVVCGKASLEDIFECFYFTTKNTVSNAKGSRAIWDVDYTWGGESYSPEPIIFDDNGVMPWFKDPNGDLALKVDAKYQKTIAPTYYRKASLIISRSAGFVFNLEFSQEYNIKDAFSMSGVIDYTNDVAHKNIPLTALGLPFVWLYADVGVFFRANATAALEMNSEITKKWRTTYEVTSKNYFLPKASSSPIREENKNRCTLMVNGSIDVGSFGEIGIEVLDKRVASAAFRGETGFRLRGDAVLYRKDAETALQSTQLYQKLKDSKVAVVPFYKIGAQPHILVAEWDNDGFKPLTKEGLPIYEASLVPTFANTKIEWGGDDSESIFVSSDASANTLTQDLGFTLIEGTESGENSNDSKTVFANYDYQGPNASIHSVFSDVKPSGEYRVYPTVNLMDVEILAEPYADLQANIRQYLVRLYSSTDGDNWIDNTNWCSDKPATEWYGVSYNSESDTYSLNLRDNNLNGTIDLSGFTNLQILDCDDNQVSHLIVSDCTSLRELYCNDSQLKFLNVSGCTALEGISCADNHLTNLDVSACKGLRWLDCSGNILASLNFSGCKDLEELLCYDNRLTNLNVSGFAKLRQLDYAGNLLTSLDVSGCKALEYLFSDDTLTRLCISGCTALTELYCEDGQLISLDASGCKNLQEINCSSNQLMSLNVFGCEALRVLDCSNNQLNSLNVSGLTNLQELECYDNLFESLDVSGCTALEDLSCGDISSLNVSGCTALRGLGFYENSLESLNASGCTQLLELNCSYCQLANLDLTGCTSLQRLICTYNKLTSLNISDCIALRELDCRNNQLTVLSGSECPELKIINCCNNQLDNLNVLNFVNIEELRCDGNKLKTLIVSGCTALKYLSCEDNLLDRLNVSGCTSLQKLYCTKNQLTSIDATNCINLEYYYLDKEHITSISISGAFKEFPVADFPLLTDLNISDCSKLEYIIYDYTKATSLTKLNVSNCTRLLELFCSKCSLDSLNISDCQMLQSIACYDNQLTSLNISGCPELKLLECVDNKLTSLDVSTLTALEKLYCAGNQLTNLDASELTNLQELSCEYNQLTVLNVSGCAKLKEIKCFENQLIILNTPGCMSLQSLSCFDNKLTGLHLSGNTSLCELSCSDNHLTSLNVSGCTSLLSLECAHNQLSHLNVSGCTALQVLSCYDNQLSGLDISTCTKLRTLYCYDNRFNREISGAFLKLPQFVYDIKYDYYYDDAGVLRTDTREYGWWYPGEPEKGYHGI